MKVWFLIFTFIETLLSSYLRGSLINYFHDNKAANFTFFLALHIQTTLSTYSSIVMLLWLFCTVIMIFLYMYSKMSAILKYIVWWGFYVWITYLPFVSVLVLCLSWSMQNLVVDLDSCCIIDSDFFLEGPNSLSLSLSLSLCVYLRWQMSCARYLCRCWGSSIINNNNVSSFNHPSSCGYILYNSNLLIFILYVTSIVSHSLTLDTFSWYFITFTTVVIVCANFS